MKSIVDILIERGNQVTCTEMKQEIQKALQSLGYSENVQWYGIMTDDQTRVKVMVEGSYFGIYDFNKHTFVD